MARKKVQIKNTARTPIVELAKELSAPQHPANAMRPIGRLILNTDVIDASRQLISHFLEPYNMSTEPPIRIRPHVAYVTGTILKEMTYTSSQDALDIYRQHVEDTGQFDDKVNGQAYMGYPVLHEQFMRITRTVNLGTNLHNEYKTFLQTINDQAPCRNSLYGAHQPSPEHVRPALISILTSDTNIHPDAMRAIQKFDWPKTPLELGPLQIITPLS